MICTRGRVLIQPAARSASIRSSRALPSAPICADSAAALVFLPPRPNGREVSTLRQ
jgi:hypothetical protein